MPGKKAQPSKGCRKRLMKEWRSFETTEDEYFDATYDTENNDMLTWYYTLRGAKDTCYAEGKYMGILRLQPDYPFKPPAILMCTPNGRVHTDQRICLSISDFHPESWNPAWNIRSVILVRSNPSLHVYFRFCCLLFTVRL
jgi:ubiquitin-conjugating enzyme E2 J2